MSCWAEPDVLFICDSTNTRYATEIRNMYPWALYTVVGMGFIQVED